MAFPTTGILDNANRANGALGAAWTTPVIFGNLAPRIVGNQFGPDVDSGNSYASAFWNGASYTDVECYLTMGTVAAARREIYARLNTENSTTENGYALAETFITANEWSLNVLFAGGYTILGIAFTQTYAIGDSFGIEVTGTGLTVTVKGYYKAAAGSWAQVGGTQSSSGSSRVTTAGHIGFALQENVAAPRADDFGGGTIIGGSPGPPAVIPVYKTFPKSILRS